MSFKQYLQVGIGLAVAVAAFAALATQGATAQNGNQSDGTANTLRVSPVRSDVAVNPGESRVVKVTVTNPTDFEVAVQPIQNDFVAGDEDGTPAIILDEAEFAESHSLKRFLAPIESVTLAAGESKVIDVEITVPADAEPGGYFGAVRFAPTSPDEGGQVNLSPSVASLVLLTVTGEAPEKLNLTEFAIWQEGRPKTFFTNGEGVVATARFQNEGNLQAGPFGKISITKGEEIVYEVDFNNKDQRDMVLPDSARRWQIPLAGVDGFGRYTVSATFTYGANNQTIESTETFWVIPLGILIGGIVAVLVAVGGVVGLIFRRRNRQQSKQPRGIGRR